MIIKVLCIVEYLLCLNGVLVGLENFNEVYDEI